MLVALAGCGSNYSPNTYSAAAVQQANKVERGVIVGVRPVGVSADSAVGTVTGAAAGGIVGSQAGTGGPITALTTLGGTVVGGLVGTTVEHATGDTNAYEYIVHQKDGSLVSVTQKDKVPLEIGQTVLVIAGKQARIVPDYTVPVPNAEPEATARKVETKPATAAVPAATATGAKPAASAPAVQATGAAPNPAAGAALPASSPSTTGSPMPAQAAGAAAPASSTATQAAAEPAPALPPALSDNVAQAAPQGAPVSLALPTAPAAPHP